MTQDMKIRTGLYQKLVNEYNEFVDKLKQSEPDKILEAAYEKVMKEETLGMFYPETENFNMEQIKALNKTEFPLEELYQGWMDSDVNLNQLYEDNVYDTLDGLIEEQKSKKKDKER